VGGGRGGGGGPGGVSVSSSSPSLHTLADSQGYVMIVLCVCLCMPGVCARCTRVHSCQPEICCVLHITEEVGLARVLASDGIFT